MTGLSESRVVAQNVAALYAAPDTDSEIVSQAVLGDRVTVLEEQGGFCRVATEDQYGGWAAGGSLVPAADDSDFLPTTISTLFADVFMAPDPRSEMITKLVAGTRVPIARRAEVGDWVPLLLPDGRVGYAHRVGLSHTYGDAGGTLQGALEGGVSRQDLTAALGRQAAETARRLIGTPYLWGGTTPFGIDCSGLTQLAFKLNGVQLLRDAHLQWGDRRFGGVEEGLPLGAALLEDGDLVFFSRREDGRPTHVGLALGDGRFVHARGGLGVRVDDCDAPEYMGTYVGARRLSADADFAVEGA